MAKSQEPAVVAWNGMEYSIRVWSWSMRLRVLGADGAVASCPECRHQETKYIPSEKLSFLGILAGVLMDR